MIKTLTIEDYSRWDHFVNENNDATFFHQAGWQDVISKAFGHQTYYIYVENKDHITGILPLVHIKSLFFGNNFSNDFQVQNY